MLGQDEIGIAGLGWMMKKVRENTAYPPKLLRQDWSRKILFDLWR
jgi:hypothetical protein